MQNLLAIFPVDAERMHSINLTTTVSLSIPVDWHTTSKAIILNILRFKGTCNYRLDKDDQNENYLLQFGMTEYLYNVTGTEDKSASGHVNRIYFELEVKKSSYLKYRGITFLSDLFNNCIAKKMVWHLTSFAKNAIT